MTLDNILKIVEVGVIPIALAVLAAFGWAVRNRIEKKYEREEYWRKLEENLRADRLKIYHDILEPFIIMFTKDEWIQKQPQFKNKKALDIANDRLLSLEYRRTGFDLSLMGSDEVVKAFNELMQFVYSMSSNDATLEENRSTDIRRLMNLLGDFLLAIRRSVGNENTTLVNLEMLEWLINDIRKYRN